MMPSGGVHPISTPYRSDAQALAGVPAGRLADRYGAQTVAAVGLALLTAGAGWLSLATPGQGAGGYVLPIIVLCVGHALFQAPNTAAVMARADANRRGAVSGLLNLARNLGLLTGASLMGTLFAAGGGAAGSAATSPEAVAAGMRVCFRIATAAAGGALVLTLSTVAIQHLLYRPERTKRPDLKGKGQYRSFRPETPYITGWVFWDRQRWRVFLPAFRPAFVSATTSASA